MLIGQKTVTTKKAWRCFGCDRSLPAGLKCKVCKWRDSPKAIATVRYCATCQRYWGLYMRYDDEIHRGELQDDFECWEAVRKEVEAT